MEPAVAPQHSLAFIRPIQRDGADDNDSSRAPSIPPPLATLFSLVLPPLLDGLSLSLLFFGPFLSLPHCSEDQKKACRSIRGLGIGWGIERREGQSVILFSPPFSFLPHHFFSFFDIFSPAPGFVSQVALGSFFFFFFFFHLIVPFSNPSSMLLGWHHSKAPASQRKSLSRPLTRLTI